MTEHAIDYHMPIWPTNTTYIVIHEGITNPTGQFLCIAPLTLGMATDDSPLNDWMSGIWNIIVVIIIGVNCCVKPVSRCELYPNDSSQYLLIVYHFHTPHISTNYHLCQCFCAKTMESQKKTRTPFFPLYFLHGRITRIFPPILVFKVPGQFHQIICWISTCWPEITKWLDVIWHCWQLGELPTNLKNSCHCNICCCCGCCCCCCCRCCPNTCTLSRHITASHHLPLSLLRLLTTQRSTAWFSWSPANRTSSGCWLPASVANTRVEVIPKHM